MYPPTSQLQAPEGAVSGEGLSIWSSSRPSFAESNAPGSDNAIRVPAPRDVFAVYGMMLDLSSNDILLRLIASKGTKVGQIPSHKA